MSNNKILGSPGENFRKVLTLESPLQIIGTINAYSALLAQQAGFRAIYLSGAGVANASYGLPDLGLTAVQEVCIDIARISSVCDLPLLVDADTGWGNALMIKRSVGFIEKAGAAGIHLEDQVAAKRCGHRPNKTVVATDTMVGRIKAAIAARHDPAFVIMARTDALAVEGLASAIARAKAYQAAGADMIFFEAAKTLEDYQAVVDAVTIPVLANITEFGQTPLFTVVELQRVGVQMVLYPLSAFRAMSEAALQVYQTIRNTGTQASLLAKMQTREALYQTLHYLEYEQFYDQHGEDL